ncbi:MAG: response regulator transcription factor [Bacteroidetes bacterium]|nr:response regulator transcription factor [Bacteroidota bacterium]
MIKCIIIEDEPQAVALLKTIVSEKFPNVEILAEFDKVSTAADFVKRNKIDFAFLDVQLNGELGLDIINYLTKEELSFEIIFTTAYGSFAVEAFSLCAIDFVLKPINEDRLTEAVNRVLKKHSVSLEQLKILQAVSTTDKIEKIVLSMSEKKIIVQVSDILYLKADNVYTEFYLTNGIKHVVSKPIKEYELLINDKNFYRPHRSYIINLKMVKSLLTSTNEIEMGNGARVNLSRDKKKEFEQLLSSIL